MTEVLQHVIVDDIEAITGEVTVVGNVASDVTDTGNPVKIAGRVSTSSPTAATTGQRKDVWQGSSGQIVVSPVNTGTQGDSQNSHTTSAPNGNSVIIGVGNALFNGSAFERQRNNIEGTALASAARTATANSADITNYNGRGVSVFVDVTAQPGGGETLSVKLQSKDSISGDYLDLADFGVLFTAATGEARGVGYPSVVDADYPSNTVAKSIILPRIFRIVVTPSAAGSWTYSVSYTLIV